MNALTAILAVLALVGIRIGLHFLDVYNIRHVAERKGWEDIQVRWSPFARGWFFERGERHYCVSFIDEQGHWRQEDCKTSQLTGVFWRDPEV